MRRGFAGFGTAPDQCRPGCVSPFCGDAIVDSNEGCDDGVNDGSAACGAGCIPVTCGDGSVDEINNEQCDDAGFSATCDDDCTLSLCGDGVTNPAVPEECDDLGESASCDVNCTVAGCGDATLNITAGESCNLGSLNSDEANDPCRSDCSSQRCGDDVIDDDLGEVCDDGGANADDPDVGCRTDCLPLRCGDGIVDAESGEECDDEGESAACDDDCSLPACPDGVHNAAAGEACDTNGNSVTCDANCTPPSCGDGDFNAAAGEACDDGPANSATCDAIDCTLASCGDGVVNAAAGEVYDPDGGAGHMQQPFAPANTATRMGAEREQGQCDLGTAVNSDAPNATCRADCTDRRCGDGIIDNTFAEACDDGGAQGSDGCSALCVVETGFQCTGAPSVCEITNTFTYVPVHFNPGPIIPSRPVALTCASTSFSFNSDTGAFTPDGWCGATPTVNPVTSNGVAIVVLAMNGFEVGNNRTLTLTGSNP